MNDAIDFYVGEVRDGRELLGTIALSSFGERDVLINRATIERAGVLTEDIEELDRHVIEAGMDRGHDEELASLGDEWPLRLGEIMDGKYPLERIPAHIRDLARELYYR